MDDLKVPLDLVAPGPELLANYRETELGSLPEEWEVVQLKEVTLRTRQANPKKSPDQHFKYVDVSAISSKSLSIEGYAEYEGKEAPSRARKVIHSGEVIFATIRPYLKRVAVVPPELEGHLCSTAFCVLRARADIIDPSFLFFVSSDDTFIERVAEHQRGSSYPAVADKDVLNELIPLPPLFEQQAIGYILRTVQKAKEATEKVISATKELKQSLMHHLFTYSPVPVDEAEQVPLKETEVGEVPEHWEVVKLGDSCRISTGTTPSTKKQEYYVGDIPFIKTAEIANNSIQDAVLHVSNQAVQDYRLKLYEPGTIFLAMYGQGKTRGQVALLNIKATTTQNTAAIVPGDRLNSHYLWCYLLSQYKALRGEGIHGQISHLNLGYVKQLKAPLPPQAEQEEIAHIISTINKKIEVEENRKQTLEVLFNTLLHNLMTGKVRVKDLDLSEVEEMV